MADVTRLTVPMDPTQVLLVGTGGEARAKVLYEGGARVEGRFVERDGGTLYGLTGVSVSVAGVGLDGAAVQTVTPMEAVHAGVVYRAEGVCEIAIRADAKPGFSEGAAPRGVLVPTVYVEQLTPVGSVADLLAQGGKAAK